VTTHALFMLQEFQGMSLTISSKIDGSSKNRNQKNRTPCVTIIAEKMSPDCVGAEAVQYDPH